MFAHSTSRPTAWLHSIGAVALIGTTLIAGPLGCSSTCAGVSKASFASTDVATRHDALNSLTACACPLNAGELGQLYDTTPDLGDRQHILQALGKQSSSDARQQLQRIADSATGTLAVQARGYLRTSMANEGTTSGTKSN